MIKKIVFIAYILILFTSCKKDSTNNSNQQEFPGRVSRIDQSNNNYTWYFEYDSEGYLTWAGVQGDDWVSFLWDRANLSIRIKSEGDFAGIKNDVSYKLNSKYQYLNTITTLQEKFIYDSIGQLSIYVFDYNDTIYYSWKEGDVISKIEKKYDNNNVLISSKTWNFNYGVRLENRDFGIKQFSHSTEIFMDYYNELGFPTKHLCESYSLIDNLTAITKNFTISYSFDNQGRVKNLNKDGFSYTYSYY